MRGGEKLKRRAIALVLAALFAGVTMGQDSCSEDAKELEDATRDLEDISGENDARYRAKMRQVKLGMSRAEVRRIMGQKPRDKQVFRTEFGRDESWYYGSWQLNFENNKLRSKNRY
jgi:outer membrane protein assembly factor BamE (lipoprotein component of BamABCDE complex)